jgi:RNA polymerase sigma-70 factor (ECF subfamily)
MSSTATSVGGALPSTPVATSTPSLLDAESRELLHALRSSGRAHDEACARLHELLLRAARFEISRRAWSLTAVEAEDLANEAADDALVAVLPRLDDFQGLSRLTTWVYKFAIYEAAVKVRRRAWRDREIPLEPESWSLLPSGGRGPEDDLEQTELLRALRMSIESDLTPHQRRVLVALALNGVPIDVLAERLSTTRGALYKTLHDARVKLRKRLTEQGLSLEAWEGTN